MLKGTLTTVYTRCAEPLTAPCRKTGHSNACVCVCEGSVVRKVWNVFLIKWQRCTLKQSMQLVHACATVKLAKCSTWNTTCQSVLLEQTHSSASSQGSQIYAALYRLPVLPPQVWLTGIEQDGSPTPTFPS